MEWEAYKRRCERADHFSRWGLQLTCASIADADVRRLLARALDSTPLRKPASHHGGAETDYFQIDIALHHARRIVAQLERAAWRAEGKQRRRLNHLRVVWCEYTEFLEGC